MRRPTNFVLFWRWDLIRKTTLINYNFSSSLSMQNAYVIKLINLLKNMLSLRKYHHCIRTPTNFTNEQKWMSNSIVLLHVAECSCKKTYC